MAIDTVALVALVVSALALLTTTAQLLQQYFATADGYRQCQPSVMGPWGKRTRMRWRWKEFRFETLYAVPRLSFALPELRADGSRSMPPFIDQPDLQAVQVTTDKTLREGDWHGELVGWVYMLQYLALHDLHCRLQVIPLRAHRLRSTASETYHGTIRCPKVDVMSRSWDFVPLDVVRPLAITTVSAVAIAARRLGMTWKQFEPSTGAFLAEGNHQVILSTLIRGLGTCFHYTRDPILDEDPIAQAIIKQTSASHISDDLGFGRLGRAGLFGTRDFHLLIGNWSDVAATIPRLFADSQVADIAISALRGASESTSKDWMAYVNDVVPFLSPYLGISCVERSIIPWPNTSPRGLTCTAFLPFEEQLIAYINRKEAGANTTTSKSLLGFYQRLDRGNGSSQPWRKHSTSLSSELDRFSPDGTKLVLDVFEEIGELLAYNPVVRAGKYKDIVAWHLLVMSRSVAEISPTDSSKMQKLFTSLPELSENIRASWTLQQQQPGLKPIADSDTPSEDIIECSWIAMFLRAMCWQRLHIVAQPGAAALPLAFEESKLPIYIG